MIHFLKENYYTLNLAFALVMVGMIALSILGTGCATSGMPDEDCYPAGYESQFAQAKQVAMQEYRDFYHAEPVVKPIRGYIEDSPRGTSGAWYTGRRIYIWKDQRPFVGSLVHEFGHGLDEWNNKPQRYP